MKKVYIVRHGETDINKQGLIQGRGIDAPLNETGIIQAEALCSFFRNRHIDAIAVSSLHRTHRTAQPVAGMKNISMEIFPELDEMSYGEYEGVSVHSVDEKMIEIKRNWHNGNTDVAIPGGESPDEVYRRASGRIHHLLDDRPERHWMFMLHGRLIRILLSGWIYNDLRYMEKIQHTNAGINVLQFDNGRFEPLLLNYSAHLNNSLAVSD